MCKRAGLLVGWDDSSRRALVTWANCDSWDCSDCKVRMAERWALRAELGVRELLAQGDVLDFVTITSHEKLRDFEATERVWRVAWQALYHALKRQKLSLEYMIVPEKHKSGRMHVHALWNAGVSERWLKNNARKRGLGYQCKIIPISNSGFAQKYITKYVGKDLGEEVPPHFRRVRVSQGWAEIPDPVSATCGLRWEFVGTNGALSIVYEECQEKHITLIDIETGAIFDDVDLGTTVYAGNVLNSR